MLERGYRTLAMMPGLWYPWPEGAFYGFDAIYGEREVDYRGPEFGWWRIPDQFTFARVKTLAADASRDVAFLSGLFKRVIQPDKVKRRADPCNAGDDMQPAQKQVRH